MIGKSERHCPRCGAGLCRYNPGIFCWPCTAPGYAWHYSELLADWVRIEVLKPEREWQPGSGDIVLGSCFEPAPRKKDNWDKWRYREMDYA